MPLVKVKRGLKANLPVLVNGELGFCEDTGELFVGSPTGNCLINSSGGDSSGDMLKSIYDTNNDGIVDVAASAPWSGITGKPSTFTPSAHGHTSAQITNFWNFWIGVPIPWYTETPPAGFIELNGAAISRTTYSRLFAKYGTRFGAGNGSTTFNVMDIRAGVIVNISGGG